MVRCNDREGECFAREHGLCKILTSAPARCSFKKPVAEITNGVRYPYNPGICGINDANLRAIMSRAKKEDK